jgi:chemotaxis response regulator CheB
VQRASSLRRLFISQKLGTTVMSKNGRNIIVIGTSAGGLEALDALIGQLSTDIPASIFIVQHLAPENTGQALPSVPI